MLRALLGRLRKFWLCAFGALTAVVKSNQNLSFRGRPNIQCYFLLSSIAYFSIGVIILIYTPQVKTFLCHVEANYNASAGIGMGCDNCSHNIVLCHKPACLRSSFNITYKARASTQKMQYYEVFDQMNYDHRCLNLGSKAVNPSQFVELIQSQGNNVGDGCLGFWCGVLETVLLENDLASGTGTTCTNKYGAKQAWNENVCVCQNEYNFLLSGSSRANEIVQACSLMSLVIEKTNFAPVPSAPTPVPTLNTTSETLTETSTTTMTTPAGSAKRLLMDQDRDFGVNWIDDQDGEVGGSWAGDHSRESRGNFGDDKNGVFRSERTDEHDQDFLEKWTDEHMRDFSGKWTDEQSRELGGNRTNDYPRGFHGNWADCAGGQSGDGCDVVAADRRQLQDTDAEIARAQNDKREKWSEGAWTACTCFQQCMKGVMSRTVECLALNCQDPKPPSKKSCECDHCADCSVLDNLNILNVTFVVQGGVALLVVLCFAYFESMKEEAREETFIHLPFYLYPLGFLCKTLPSIVRLLILVNFCQISIIVFYTWLPTNIKRDCNASGSLKIVSMVTFLMLCLQLVAGQAAKRYTVTPPYLYSPVREHKFLPFKIISLLTRALGP
eukprot:TRINITY_DN11052_c0_g1_i1.p1 TRINITY_DN11052_c0_g1~~TRINITY_DN11052_c0_g1_i1.p1  ORF type:complete len:633 (-),score=85.28 TRINITY_DN11052_c0_g1_i1:236-2068(-)